jgi:hypothetical protein
MSSDKLYDETLDLLKKGHDGLMKPTNNEDGMPAHLMHVASVFNRARQNVDKLEKIAIKSSQRWSRKLYAMSNLNNSNNNSTKKRKRSISYNSYFNNTNNEKNNTKKRKRSINYNSYFNNTNNEKNKKK